MGEQTFTAKIISEGRITVPETTRMLLDLKEGDIVEVKLRRIEKEVKPIDA